MSPSLHWLTTTHFCTHLRVYNKTEPGFTCPCPQEKLQVEQRKVWEKPHTHTEYSSIPSKITDIRLPFTLTPSCTIAAIISLSLPRHMVPLPGVYQIYCSGRSPGPWEPSVSARRSGYSPVVPCSARWWESVTERRAPWGSDPLWRSPSRCQGCKYISHLGLFIFVFLDTCGHTLDEARH